MAIKAPKLFAGHNPSTYGLANDQVRECLWHVNIPRCIQKLHNCVCCFSPPGGGKQGKNAAKQPLFLVYLDAISVTKHSKAARTQEEQPAEGSVAAMLLEQQQQGQQEGQGDGQQLAKQLSSAPPNMPGFSVRDLQFVLTFTGEHVLDDA